MTDARQENRAAPEAGGTPLAGRATIVTRASSGTGRATARALAAAGARVGLAARRAGRLEEAREGDRPKRRGGPVLPADVTDYAQAEARSVAPRRPSAAWTSSSTSQASCWRRR